MTAKILYVDVVPDDVFQQIASLTPPGFTLERIETSDVLHLCERAEGSRYFLVGHLALPRAVIESAMPSLKLIQKLGRGVDQIDLDMAIGNDIAVAVTAGGNSQQVAEHTVMLMLAALRCLGDSIHSMRMGEWPRDRLRFTVRGLKQRRVGLIGFGHIGQAVARCLAGFDVELVYSSPSRAPATVEAEFNARFISMEELLQTSDIVSLHMPLMAATNGLIDDDALSQVKSDVIIINTSRGAIIDEVALVNKLREQKIGAAGLDVYAEEPLAKGHPLRTFSNVILTPHIAGSSFENLIRVARCGFANIRSWNLGEGLPESDIIYVPQHS